MSRYQRRQPDDIYAEILCKFILNLPKEELKPERIWYHFQKAFFYYVDHEKSKHSKQDNPDEKLIFYQKITKLAPIGFKYDPKQLIDWQGYFYKRIPVYGAILLNQKKTKVVVCHLSQTKKIKYGFPKGKIDQGETPTMCARREVWEQIGYDVEGKINENQYIKVQDQSKTIIFFVVKGIKEETTMFKTQASFEVKDVEWIPLSPQYPNLTRYTRDAMTQLVAFLYKEQKAPKSFFEIFLENFKIELNKDIEPPEENPFINFKFDRQKLLSILR